MNKWGPFLLLLLLISGCGHLRIRPEESFLRMEKTDGKICILSVIPNDKTQSGVFISNLLLLHSTENGNQLTTYSHSFDPTSGSTHNWRHFSDSLQKFDSRKFPLYYTIDLNDSVNLFSFSMDRSTILMSSAGNDTLPELLMHVIYPEQRPYKPAQDETNFGIHSLFFPAIRTKSSIVESMRFQSSVMLHTVEKGALLFGQTGIHYRWIDCCLNDSTTCTLFYSYDSGGKCTLIYAICSDQIIPENVTFTDYNTIEFNLPKTDFPYRIAITPTLEKPMSRQQFGIDTIEVQNRGTISGKGILYKL
jgi:hypothetical protein